MFIYSLIFFILIMIYIFRIFLIYVISLITSKITCSASIYDNFIKCKHMFISNSDMSGPSNSFRIGIEWEAWMRPIIEKYKNKTKNCIDIGAHIGTHTKVMSEYFKTVYAFEPNPVSYYNLSVNVAEFPNVNIFNYALGSSQKKTKLNMNGISTHSVTETFENTDTKMIYLDNTDVKDVAFIKMDTEGTEIDIIRGMKNIIKRDKPVIVFEDHTGNTIDYLKKKHKYKITKINSTNYIAYL